VLVDLPFAGNVTGEVRLLPLDGLQQRLQRRVEAAWKESMAAIGVDTGRLRIERLWRSVRPVVPTVALWPSWVLGEGAAGCVIPAFGFLAAPRASEPPEDLPFDADPSRGLVVFVAGTLGTTRWWANRFFETSAEICRHLECAGVFLGGDATPEPQPGWISDLAIRRDFLPLRDVLPHASAIVHHGGMGTAAAAIECGVPQVVVPRVFAQPHNAEWLRRLGLCLVLDSHAYTASQGSAAVREVVGNPRYRSTAQSYAPRCDSEGGLRSACEYLESPSVMGGIRSAALRPHERRTGSKGPAWAKRSGLDG
jgi:UDP:flavonoid glycosyltransferase YjiC (YdhE family)